MKNEKDCSHSAIYIDSPDCDININIVCNDCGKKFNAIEFSEIFAIVRKGSCLTAKMIKEMFQKPIKLGGKER